MRLAVSKWGNSLAIRLPREMASELDLIQGSPIEVRSNGQEIIITRASEPYSLRDLVSKISDSNRHSEIVASPIGREVW